MTNTINFIEKKDKDPKYQCWECEFENNGEGIIRILKNENHPFYSVYLNKFICEDGEIQGHIEIASNKSTNLKQAKSTGEKLLDIALWFKIPEPGKEY